MLNASRLTTVLALAAIAALVSCVPAATDGGTTPDPNAGNGAEKKAPPPPEPEDIALDGFDEVKFAADKGGVLFSPEAVGVPGMVRVVPKRKTTLAKQRKKQARAKAAKKGTETKVLVTLLWDESKNAPNEQARKALREEARQALLAAQTSMGEQFDEVLLQMLFTAEVYFANDEGAATAGTTLLTRFPDSGSAKALAPWVSYFLLRTWKTAEAAKIVGGWTLDQLQPAQYMSAYVLAWHHFRARDYAKASEALVWALRNWKSRSTKPSAEKELVLMLSRGGTALDQVLPIFAELTAGKVETQYEWLYQMYQGYEFSGYRVLAAESLERGLALLGDKVPPPHRVYVPQRQFNNYLAAHHPDKAAAKLIAAYEALPICGAPCQPNTDGIAGQIKGLAPHFHATYSTTQDDRFYGPAETLYNYYIKLGRPDAAEVQSTLTGLKETKQRARPHTGRHDKTTMEWSTSVRNNTIKACYESVLQGEPALAGSLKVMLEVNDKGEVTGATTEPAAGEAGMAAVGGCVAERAKTWIFPGRSKPGKTTVTRTYSMEPKK